MKDLEVIYLNSQHENIIDNHIKMVKELMYYATETTKTGKFQDFLTVLDSIYFYSNNFHQTMINKESCDRGSVAEFLFLIPNMSFYTSVGFLTALKDGENDLEMRDILEKIGVNCESTTSELGDLLIDETDKDKIIKDIFESNLDKN